VETEITAAWKSDYRKMIQKACVNTQGNIPILKNPCNTGRIRILLKMYPNAKFIHIVRNPVVVFLSARKFFLELLPTLWFHEVDEKFIEEMLFDVYELLVKDLIELKDLIPEKNFIEFKFEDFEIDPFPYLARIYSQFDIPDFSKAKPHFESYIQKMSGYRKNKYRLIEEGILDQIYKRWGFAMEKWEYELPENLEITKKEAVH
jgi:hypothetical protein